jgi:hypothetical protein
MHFLVLILQVLKYNACTVSNDFDELAFLVDHHEGLTIAINEVQSLHYHHNMANL